MHAISNAGALEAAHYRQIDRDDRQARQAERIADRADEVIGTFDAKDAADALDASAARSDRMHDRLCEALSGLVQISDGTNRPAVRAVIDAWQDVATSYAMDLARKELAR
jgi:hypothetical protein